MEAVFQALGSATRRRILAYLSRTSLTAGQISDRFDMSKPAISKHLRVLENAGLVTRRKDGLFVHYHLAKDNLFASLNDFLVNFCPEGRPLKLEGAAIGRENEEARG